MSDYKSSNSDLLTELREAYDRELANWKSIREEARLDMICVAGDPWSVQDPQARTQRQNAGRLVLSFDEINQYCNQLINDVRQNKRAVKVLPKGNGANDQTAEYRGGMIRQIEYKSKAQAAYRTAFEGVIQRSYGAWKYKTQYVADSSFDQEIVVVRIPNPDTIYMDWDAKESDYSDAGHAFEVETMDVKEFRRKWPEATVQNFTTEHMKEFGSWIKSEQRLQVASYWKVHKTGDRLFLLESGQQVLLSDLKKEYKGKAQVKENYLQLGDEAVNFINDRRTESREVVQYITNGLEILEENPWVGKYIPIVFITGKELYVDEGGGAERKLLSLVRLAREPYLAYCYLWTSQVEMAQMAPKSPLMGYEGQFATNTDWGNINKILTPYIEVKGTTPESVKANPTAILPLPTRPQYSADIQSLEIMKESCRRAIQSAMGITGLLNGATNQQEAKSGVALKTLDQQESQSNFHFIDNFDGGLEFGGRIQDDLLDKVYDVPNRQVGIRTHAGEHQVITANPHQVGPDGKLLAGEDGEPVRMPGFHTDTGDHDVTISTGPSFESERDEAEQFTEQLTKTGDPVLTRALLPQIIKLRNLGPIGEELVKIAQQLSPLNQPQQQIPPAVQMQIQKLTAMVQRLTMEKKAKLVEIQGKMQLEAQKQQGENWKVTQQQSVDLEKTRMNNIAMIQQSLAKIGQATQAEQIGAELEKMSMLWESMHEFTQLGLEHQHEKDLAAQTHQQTLEQANQQAALNPPQPQQPQA